MEKTKGKDRAVLKSPKKIPRVASKAAGVLAEKEM
jgi:hypothetical protein